MQNLQCADFELPLCFVQAVSWTRRAKTVQHVGGYVTSRGFESAEISVKLRIDFAVCKTFGIDPHQVFYSIDATATDRTSQSGVFYLGKYAVYPSLEFALTNINKTYSPELGVMECDCVWSGVKPVKNVARENALTVDPSDSLPKITISYNGKSLVMQDFCSINQFVTMPDAIQLAMTLGSDLDLVNRKGFMTDLLNGGTITAELQTGTVVYFIVSADLTDERLTMTGSVYPPTASRAITKTYTDTTIKSIVDDLCRIGGIDGECIADGQIDYYLAMGSPLENIRSLQQGAGFITSVRAGRLTCANVPAALQAETEIEYIEINQDSDVEFVSGCVWYDGINTTQSGTLDKNSIVIRSPFRSTHNYAAPRLAFERYNRNSIVVKCEIMQNIDAHSVVSVQSNDSIINCMVEWFETDWINNMMSLELHYIGG